MASRKNPRPPKEHEVRLERVERLLAQGKTDFEIVELLIQKPPTGWAVARKVVHGYLDMVYDRWKAQAQADSGRRRERYLRMAENVYVKAEGEGKYSAAVSALNLAAQIAGVFQGSDESRASVLERLGPIPNDPAQVPVFVQRVLVLNMVDVLGNAQMDPAMRHKILADYSAKLVASQPKALAGRRIEELEQQVQTLAPSDPSQLVDGETVDSLRAFAEELRAAIADSTIIDEAPTSAEEQDE